jgi:hypothetical protein
MVIENKAIKNGKEDWQNNAELLDFEQISGC